MLQQRKAAVAQLALVLEIAQDLEAAQASLEAPPGPEAAAAALLNDPERLAKMLGFDDDDDV